MTWPQVRLELGIDNEQADAEQIRMDKQVAAMLKTAAANGLTPQAFARLGAEQATPLINARINKLFPMKVEQVAMLLEEPEFQ